MTDSTKFLRLRELTDALGAKIELLQSGHLSRTDLEKLTNESRELYERLVVLRYRAYSAEVKGPEEEEISKEDEIKPAAQEIPVINFKLDEVKTDSPQQVSLIDAIEEVTKNEMLPQVAEHIAEAVVEVDHTSDEELSADTQIEEVAEEITPPTSSPSHTLHDYMLSNSLKESLHEKLAKGINHQESLAQKLEHNAIADLKRAITLNQRFQFSKELFKGNNQDYEVAIDKLNTSSRDEAMKHLDSLRNKYAWNAESLVAHDFVELVERRHL